MTIPDTVEFIGYLLGSWALGYMTGFGILSIRKFFEQV